MDFNKALEIVRRIFKNDLIWYGHEFDGKFIFVVSAGKTFNKDSYAVGMYYVDKVSGEHGTYFDPDSVYEDPDLLNKLDESLNNKIFVDITKEQFEKE